MHEEVSFVREPEHTAAGCDAESRVEVGDVPAPGEADGEQLVADGVCREQDAAIGTLEREGQLSWRVTGNGDRGQAVDNRLAILERTSPVGDSRCDFTGDRGKAVEDVRGEGRRPEAPIMEPVVELYPPERDLGVREGIERQHPGVIVV